MLAVHYAQFDNLGAKELFHLDYVHVGYCLSLCAPMFVEFILGLYLGSRLSCSPYQRTYIVHIIYLRGLRSYGARSGMNVQFMGRMLALRKSKNNVVNL